MHHGFLLINMAILAREKYAVILFPCQDEEISIFFA